MAGKLFFLYVQESVQTCFFFQQEDKINTSIQQVPSTLIVSAIVAAEEDFIKAGEQLMVNPKDDVLLKLKLDSTQQVS